MHPLSRSVSIYHRNFAQVLTHGLGITWMENSDLAEDPSLIPTMLGWQKRYDDIGQWAVGLNRAPSADVAVFFDDYDMPSSAHGLRYAFVSILFASSSLTTRSCLASHFKERPRRVEMLPR